MSTLNLTQLAEPVSGECKKAERFQLPLPSNEGQILIRYYFEREDRGSEILAYHEELDIKCHPGKEFGYEIKGSPDNPPELKYPYTEHPPEKLIQYLREHLPEHAARVLPQPKSF